MATWNGQRFPRMRTSPSILTGALCLYLGFMAGAAIFGEELHGNTVLFCLASLGVSGILYLGGWLVRRGLKKLRARMKADREPYEQYRNEAN